MPSIKQSMHTCVCVYMHLHTCLCGLGLGHSGGSSHMISSLIFSPGWKVSSNRFLGIIQMDF